jgi:16S rRNA (adenine1518-N6/adenine1519-N6)-dimethyltransferase
MTNGKRQNPRDSSTLPRSQKARAKKSLGQNFLVDESVVEKIMRAVDPREGETIVEIGPGHGALTSSLLDTASRIVAIEFDRDLVPLLRERFGTRKNFVLVEDDALDVDYCSLIAPASNARVVANLPYNISTVILQRLLEQRACLSELTLMLQREVAARVTAAPSTSERGYLSVLVEAFADVDKLFDVAQTAFRPSPKVWSTVVRLRPKRDIAVDLKDEALLWRIVSAGFAQRRKTIFNNLRNANHLFPVGLAEDKTNVSRLLETAGVELNRRAESLSLEEWSRISTMIEKLWV